KCSHRSKHLLIGVTSYEKLSGPFFGKLRKSFFKVFCFHWVFCRNSHEKLRRKTRNPCVTDHLFTHREGVPNLVFPGVVKTDDVSCISFFSDFPVTCLENKGSSDLDFFPRSYVKNFIVTLEFSGTHT